MAKLTQDNWTVDTTHSNVSFSVRHMVMAKVRGRFGDWHSALTLDEEDLTRSRLEVSIAAASIDTGVADRDAHLRGADFLDVETYPEITYRSRRVERVGDGRYRVIGDLTIHGVTREIPLEVEFGGRGKDPWGNERLGFAATAAIDRKNFGLTWNQVLEAGGVLVGDRINVEIELEAVRAALTPAAGTGDRQRPTTGARAS